MTPRAERTQKLTKIFKKLEKICIKLSVYSDRLFVSSHGGGGGGGGAIFIGGGGVNSGGVFLQPLRTALHIISISLQNSLS